MPVFFKQGLSPPKEGEESGEVTTRSGGGEQEKYVPCPSQGSLDQQLRAVDLVYEKPGPPHHPAQPAQATAGGKRPARLQRHLVAVRRDSAPISTQALE